ncbi:uncharacterized protein EV420DRAFT_1475775 [Desarmillaria tabescens]|uniref:Uncharacterized protein n=1 Tax=Armillaria tabescens TaxID=1929756 RepID=A0AA39NEQ8_ARMTA|nr:uncharacterized protein EV420DRAFT_1475775 [Desarmillaria tabescens]KAK0464267.1 hypothetical protein EV420DRAFT_1475775 [Desarmillaria tabescens]
MNSQSAVAHKFLFNQIRRIVFEDTGKDIQYHHLHSPNLSSHQGICHWGIDQDRGQAKGLGMHLQQIAQEELPHSTLDLHEPWKRLVDLTDYEHVHRLVSEAVKTDMRSLMCIEHPDWEGTLQRIRQEGKAAGNQWLDDKINSGFALEAMCQAKSKIPLDIWCTSSPSTNLSEALHADVNREGIQCLLVGAICRGHHYDLMHLKAQQVHSTMGILSCNNPTNYMLRESRSLQRLSCSQSGILDKVDAAIEKQNQQLRNRHEQYRRAHRASLESPNDCNLQQKAQKAQAAFETQKEKSHQLEQKCAGSAIQDATLTLPESATFSTAKLLKTNAAEALAPELFL